MRNGQGTLWIKDEKSNLRRRYTGDWCNDKKEGRGTMFFPTEDRYDGFWKENQPSGEGRMIYKNGDVYVGQWHDGKRSGYGVFTR
jgi:radial spoke head protein 1